MRNIVGLLLLACLTSGCATGRTADLRDCGRLSVGVGPGLDVAAKVGCIVHPSLGIGSDTHRIGFEDRYRLGTWEEAQIVWPVSLLGQMLDNSFGSSGTLLTSFAHDRKPRMPDGGEYHTAWLPVLQSRNRSQDPLAFHELTNIEIGATLGLISAKVGVNPLEILDSLLGCVGLDIAGDDPKKEDKPTQGRTVPPEAGASGVQ